MTVCAVNVQFMPTHLRVYCSLESNGLIGNPESFKIWSNSCKMHSDINAVSDIGLNSSISFCIELNKSCQNLQIMIEKYHCG